MLLLLCFAEGVWFVVYLCLIVFVDTDGLFVLLIVAFPADCLVS